MSLAWGTVALLTFLLPGFLFFVGIYMPEKFTRDAARRSVLGQLAGTIMIAVGVHGVLYLALGGLCALGEAASWVLWTLTALAALAVLRGFEVPAIGLSRMSSLVIGVGTAVGALVVQPTTFCVDLSVVLTAFQVQGAEAHIPLPALAANIQHASFRILLYLGISSGMGLWLGWIVGGQVLQGNLRFLAQHPWVYRLAMRPESSGDAFTFAYILTHVRQEDRVLLYRGALRDFALDRDGTFSYLVLTGPQRGYLRLHDPKSMVSIDTRPIGVDKEETGPEFSSEAKHPSDDGRLLVVEGEDVANVVFERSRYRETDMTDQVVQAALKHLREKYLGDLSQLPFDEFEEDAT